MENSNTTHGFSFDLPKGNSSIIKVIGVGGGGNNALKHMYERGIFGVDFVICNTDSQTLDNNPVPNKVQLGVSTTEGLGAGADPEVGEKAAIESMDDIKAALGSNTKMVFITAGMGGGTGTGAAPVIAKAAKEAGILTVGIVTIPFSFEGKRRLEQAETGLDKLRANVDSLIVINNDKLRQQFGNLGFKSGFAKADEVLTNAAKGMAEVITGYFDVNIDFRDAKSVLQNSGTALMSNGVASGENKAEEAVKKALDSPLLNDNKITGAKNVLLLIRSGSEEVTMDEIGVIMDHIQEEAGNTADIIFGVGSDEELGDAVSVLVIATGFSKDHQKHAGPTEKVIHALHDEAKPVAQRESPFRTMAQEETTDRPKHKDFFRLDDEDDGPAPEFPINSAETAGQAARSFSREVTDVEFFDHNEQSTSFGNERWQLENDPENFSLFSFTKFEDEPNQSAEQDEDVSSVEYKFASEQSGTTDGTTELPAASKTEESDEDEFVFIEKKPEMDEARAKSEERRNKLREFNTRYRSTDAEVEFETIPAFRRKNISIDDSPASENRISSFIKEDGGRVQLRENRFLNKDVD